MRRVALVLVLVVAGASCGGRTGSGGSTTAVTPVSSPTSVASSAAGTTARATSSTAPSATTSITPSTSAPASTLASVPPIVDCQESLGAPRAPGAYGEPALDRFGPLEAAPSLQVEVGQPEEVYSSFALDATRIVGGVLVVASRASSDVVARPNPVVAVDHDGRLRWTRCLASELYVQALAAPAADQPDNVLLWLTAPSAGGFTAEWLQLSLATGATQTAFRSAMASIGLDVAAQDRLEVVDTSGRFALLGERSPDAGQAVQYGRLVRYDLAADTAVDVTVPPELQTASAPSCWVRQELSLLPSGEVLVASGNALVARWRDGEWSRDPAVVGDGIGTLPVFCSDVDGLRGIDAAGRVQWSDPALTIPHLEGIGPVYVDGPVAVVQACTGTDASGECTSLATLGVDAATGAERWRLPGLALVAAEPADGYVLVGPAGTTADGSPGWALLDDRTGQAVPGQRWTDGRAFNHDCCGDSDFNRTVRSGGVVLVIEGEQVRVWYPLGAAPPR